jgi:hypothetical protein
MEWLTSTANSLFRTFIADIRRLPFGSELSQSDLLARHFRLYSENGLEIYYAPVGHIRRKAKIALIGVTPGWSQMELAYRMARSLIERWQDPSRILSEIKRQIAFAGSMRRNLLRMLNELRLHKYLGIESSEVMFEESSNLVHTTSALRYPIFYRGNNYTGHAPKILSREIHRMMIEMLLGKELCQVPMALIIPLGDAASMAVEHLVECGILDKKRCLFGFPHPSGANAHRSKEFAERRIGLRRKLQRWFELNS